VNALNDLSRPYRTPAVVANAATMIQVTVTTFSGLMPDSNAKSSLSENARMDLPVRVLFRNQNRRATTTTATTTVIAWVVLIARPSFRPVISLNSRAVMMKRSPSANLMSRTPIMKKAVNCAVSAKNKQRC